MASLAVLLIAGAATLALAGLYLVLRTRRHGERAALNALADEHGWNHDQEASAALKTLAARVLTSDDAERLRDAVAGPSIAGPFTIARTPASRSAHGDATLLHIRTAAASPGLHVRPAAGFRAGAPQQPGGRTGNDRFARLYEVIAADPAFATDALDWDTCSLLVAPDRPIRLDWLEHDLVIGFPLRARTPRSLESLVAWGAHLARRLSDDAERGHGARRRARTPDAQSTRQPAGIDPLLL